MTHPYAARAQEDADWLAAHVREIVETPAQWFKDGRQFLLMLQQDAADAYARARKAAGVE